MARSAAARLLAAAAAAAASPFRANHHHHARRRRRPLLLAHTFRSKASSSDEPARPPPRREPSAPAPRRGGAESSSLFHEISDLLTSAARPVSVAAAALPPDETNGEGCRDPQELGAAEAVAVAVAAAQRTEGARGIAPEGVTAASSPDASSIQNSVIPGGLADDGTRISGIAGATLEKDASWREAGDAAAIDSDRDNISDIVQMVTQVVRSEVPELSMEQRLESLGVTYTPSLVNMVLKRCFKVRQLAFRFFDWVKRVPEYRHTTETYNTMLYIAGEARSFGIMEELMDEMDKEMCPKDIKTWTILLASYGKAKQIGKMLSAFEALRKSGSVSIDSRAYRTILHALCNAEKPELALEFYKDMPKNMEVGSDILRLLMRCLATSDNTAEAVYFVRDDMIKGMKHPEEYCYMEALQSFCISGKLEDAWKVFQQMKNKSMADSSASENLLRGFCKAGRMDEALQIVEYMRNTSVISSTTYGILIDGYLRKGKHAEALDLLQTMREYGSVPLVSSYTQLMQHLFAIDHYEEACGLYEEMLKNGVEPDIVAITALIGGHVQSGHISKAWDLFRTINKNGQKPTLKAYKVFIQKLCKASRPLEAVELLNEMLQSDFRPSEGIFCQIISALRDKFYLEEARNLETMRMSFNLRSSRDSLQLRQLDVLDTVDKSNPEEELALEFIGRSSDQNGKPSCSLSSNSHQTEQEQDYSDADVEEICRILSSSDDWGSMQQALEMRSINFSPNLVDAILKRCKRNSRAALQFYSWVAKRSYYMPTTKSYNTAMKLAGSAKDFKHMRYLYREMLRTGCSPTVDTWNVMICQYGNAGLSEKALETFYSMKQHGFLPSGTTYHHMIMYLTYNKGLKIDAAVKIFQEMCHAGHIPDNDIVFRYLLALCECRRIADARRSVVSLCERGFPLQVGYSILLRSFCRADRMDEALSLFNCIEKHGCSRDQYMYGSLIHGLLRRERFEDAVAKLTEMKNAGIPQSAHMYTSFIVYYFQKRDVAKVLDVLKEMKENGCEPTVVTYSALIRGHMAMGMVSEAWGVFQQMKIDGPAPDFHTYSMFLSCLCKAGRSEEGLQLIHDMLDCGIIPSTVNFMNVVHGLNMEGKHKLAEFVLRSKWSLRRQRTFSN
ncbi:hypothetical protein ACP4OV_003730 [Aristida adscensionis]